MPNSSTRVARSALSILFGALAVWFAVCAAVAFVVDIGGPIVIAVELLIATTFGALCHVTGRR